MVDCYHHECDTVENMLTDDNINFLGKTTDAISKMIHTLSGPTGSVSRGSGKSLRYFSQQHVLV